MTLNHHYYVNSCELYGVQTNVTKSVEAILFIFLNVILQVQQQSDAQLTSLWSLRAISQRFVI